MLGMARASQYAGWWSGGAIKIDIPVATTVSQAAYQTPSFSWLTVGSPIQAAQYSLNGYYPSGNYGTVDLTGYTALSGFNDRRFTWVQSIYLNWTTGLADNYYGQQTLAWNTSSAQASLYVALNISGGSLSIGYGASLPSGASYNDQITLSGSYSTYANKWLTLVFSSAETSSVFANWAPVSPASQPYRFAVYDTAKGTLISKRDNNGTNTNYPSISGMGTSVPVTDNATVASTNWNLISGGPDPTVNYNIANFWYSAGTMFDPVTASATDTTWFTTRPNETIGTGKAWVNVPYASLTNNNNILLQGIKQSGTDLYTQANSVVMAGSTTSTSWDAAAVAQSQNTTNIPKDTS